MDEIEQAGETMDRRNFFAALAAPFGAALVLKASDVFAYDNPRRWVRTPVRRRIRRPVVIRTRFGRPFWVVPLGLVAGWELSNANRVVVVRETHFIEKAGVRSEVAIVQDTSEKIEQVEITREDTAENSKNLQGSVLDEDDTTTPAIVSASR
jgi:hypothetical protein